MVTANDILIYCIAGERALSYVPGLVSVLARGLLLQPPMVAPPPTPPPKYPPQI